MELVMIIIHHHPDRSSGLTVSEENVFRDVSAKNGFSENMAS